MTKHDAPEKVDLESLDVAEERRRELVRLFPEVRTEGGKIDFDRLKMALGETVEAGKERYGLTWPGKAECFRTLQAPSMATLRPCRDDSVSFDTTENLIIEGDNLEVLKLLQKSYLGKVKMIYIDPPYNTGNDFIYPDNYSESLQTYLQYTGQADAEGKKFGTNTDADGRFHSKWLNMMYPRLSLARNLLREDGVIFISVDDGEVGNLRKLCDEIFGEENFLAAIIWQKVYAPKNTARHFSEDHDYVISYARRSDRFVPNLLERTKEQDDLYQNPDADPRGPWMSDNLTARNFYGEGIYDVTSPQGRIFSAPKGRYWAVKKEKFIALNAEGRIWWGRTGDGMPRLKRFLSEVKRGVVPQTLWTFDEVGHTQDAKKELLETVAFEQTDNVLDTVKPTKLLKRMLQIATASTEPHVVLDFFAGSGATGHAVLEQNQEDGGIRRFVLVQLPQPLPASESKLKTIADITRARVRHVAQHLLARSEAELPVESERADLGFKALRLADSNFAAWSPDASVSPDRLEQQLALHVAHVRQDRTAEDILLEILIKEGYAPSAHVEAITVAHKPAFSVSEGGLIVCIDRELTLEAIRAVAERAPGPGRVVCLDEGFAGNDQLKANAVEIFKSKGIVFRTV